MFYVKSNSILSSICYFLDLIYLAQVQETGEMDIGCKMTTRWVAKLHSPS